MDEKLLQHTGRAGAHIPSSDHQYLLTCARMSHQETAVFRPEHAVFVRIGSDGDRPAGKIPSETYPAVVSMNNEKNSRTDLSHPIGLLCQNIDHKFLVRLSPSLHLRVTVHNESDVFRDILRLSDLIM